MIMKHFIFGYGSLICPQSRAITAPSLDAVAEPVVITGIERTWSARVTRRQSKSSKGKKMEDDDSSSTESDGRDHIRGWTPMGVRFRPGAKCNGILIHVDEEELMRFDVREAGYERQRIDLADIHRHIDSDKLVDSNMPLWPSGNEDPSSSFGDEVDDVQCPECRLVFDMASEKRRETSKSSREDQSSDEVGDIAVWVYVQSKNLPAERSFPITQSYVDIIMRGCLSISHDFARRFLETTHGWWHDGAGGDREMSLGQNVAYDGALDTNDPKNVAPGIDEHHTWVNDRHDPMYVRADSEYSLENGDEIDKLIEEHHPHALKKRMLSM
jgi:hypothetical protein